MPADWKTNSTTPTRRGFVLQHLCEEEMRSFWDVLPTHRCEGGNVTLLPLLHCVQWWCRAERGAAQTLTIQAPFMACAGALFQSAGRWMVQRHGASPNPRSLGARHLRSLHFSCSVANASGKSTPGLQALFFALALDR